MTACISSLLTFFLSLSLLDLRFFIKGLIRAGLALAGLALARLARAGLARAGLEIIFDHGLIHAGLSHEGLDCDSNNFVVAQPTTHFEDSYLLRGL